MYYVRGPVSRQQRPKRKRGRTTASLSTCQRARLARSQPLQCLFLLLDTAGDGATAALSGRLPVVRARARRAADVAGLAGGLEDGRRGRARRGSEGAREGGGVDGGLEGRHGGRRRSGGGLAGGGGRLGGCGQCRGGRGGVRGDNGEL